MKTFLRNSLGNLLHLDSLVFVNMKLHHIYTSKRMLKYCNTYKCVSLRHLTRNNNANEFSVIPAWFSDDGADIYTSITVTYTLNDQLTFWRSGVADSEGSVNARRIRSKLVACFACRHQGEYDKCNVGETNYFLSVVLIISQWFIWVDYLTPLQKRRFAKPKLIHRIRSNYLKQVRLCEYYLADKRVLAKNIGHKQIWRKLCSWWELINLIQLH